MKRVSFLIVMVLLVALLVGCASQGNNGPHGEGNAPPDTSAPESDTPQNDVPNEGDNDGNNGGETAPEGDTDGSAKPDVPPPIVEEKPAPKEYQRIVVVKAQKVNIRSGKGSNHRVLGTMKRGEGLSVVSYDGDGWYKVYYTGKHAYISSSYVHEISVEKSGNSLIESVVYEGNKLMGFPYVWGSQRYHWGNGILNKNFRYGEFDCSALVQYIYHKGARINIDVTTRGQVQEGELVTGDIRRGDLMFFTNAARRNKKGVEKVGHVAMYLGDNFILHTATGYAVIEEISASRWSNYLVSKRFLV